MRGNVFCDHKCYTSSKAHAERIRERTLARFPDAKVEVTCAECGKVSMRAQSQTQNRDKLFCDRECKHAYMRKQGAEQLTSGGYVKVYVGFDYPGATKTGHIMQHRKVMQDILGRPLVDEENVHHINGVRSDNRPENLELWSSSQPKGQRVQDKVEWARSILALYGDLPPIGADNG
jgi:endogenous inhibitor of DNA gyrase (YacG/DUF329 family)